ncbi:hypothetical protein MM1S1540310_4003 [Mycobacteroides abscessus subsp. bolletii 1S-154-0310]|nr:hypothetical protein [Mycobacteroides abscessus]EIU59212.1 hypothetical protein MM1S1510930_4447 [Mycobacteroides abscessus subsp. bolletii 1S-151-0930]EIU68808.1 hypothetical protein MM1S1520914_4655 [Mycobacteroides abscessus subsp. bolletii 1S-152-0914]EIU71199.1 hypothetical protein MM1S1530915_3999 [Mycobacteroides abscessus subsp. bolletii 1S-153-0915]EIU80832.1 hypothetical protein MM1S1540310_4003 [Mycobacteroides abscessus subsp. bolletii 1S-154-0310]MBE5480735.1 hypothetical prote
MPEPDLKVPDCAGLDPRLAAPMARQHAATVAAVEAAARDLADDGSSQ